MKTLLLADANRLLASPADHATTRQQRNAAVYQTFILSEADFNDLVFMEANDNVWTDNQALVDTLTPVGQSRTLKEVVDRVLKAYPYPRPIQVFKHLSADEPWFEGCFIISARFDPRLLGELLIRPLAAYEKSAHPPEIRFYLEDGNHRALVYAVSLRLQAEAYQPVRAIFSQDWSHLYPWGQLTALEEKEKTDIPKPEPSGAKVDDKHDVPDTVPNPQNDFPSDVVHNWTATQVRQSLSEEV